MSKIILVGAAGKMGLELKNLIGQDKALQLVNEIDPSFKNEGVKAPNLAAIKNPAADVIIDFSSIEGLSEVIAFCTQHKIPLLSGTTGISQEQLESLEGAGKIIPTLWSSNMSVGVAVMNEMLQNFAPIKQYDY